MPNTVRVLERLVGTDVLAGIAAASREYFSNTGERFAAQVETCLRAFNATDDLVPFFGDSRLAHTEAYFQLGNSFCLAHHGFYSQAFSTLRSVCELSLLQATLPEGEIVSDRAFEALESRLPGRKNLPSREQANWILPVGFGASQTPERVATTLLEWAIDGCRTPRASTMLKLFLKSELAREFDLKTGLSARFTENLSSLDSYVHARGRLRSATGLSFGNSLRFSAETVSEFCARLHITAQVSVAVLLVAFVPLASDDPRAAAGFIDAGDFQRALGILPPLDAELLRRLRERNTTEDNSVHP